MQESEETITLILPYRGGTISQDNIIIRREIPMMTFGPISIRPDLQRQGLGEYLLDYSMERARDLGGPGPCALRTTSIATGSPAL